MLCKAVFVALLLTVQGLRMQRRPEKPELKEVGAESTEEKTIALEGLEELGLKEFAEWRYMDLDVVKPPVTLTNQAALPGCTPNAVSPMQTTDKPILGKQLTARVQSLMDTVDHIYVVCIKCDRSLPAALLKKASIINGKKSDGCLGFYRSTNHHSKATGAHKLAAVHAKQNKFKTIMVLEEDVTFNVASDNFDLDSIKDFVKSDKEWNVIRMGWKTDYSVVEHPTKGGACKAQCKCDKWVEKNLCTMQSSHCGLKSSVGYILHERAYDSFVQEPDLIDNEVLNHFKQSTIVPALVHQEIKVAQEIDSEKSFVKNCKAH